MLPAATISLAHGVVVALLFAGATTAQVNYPVQTFPTNTAGWTSGGGGGGGGGGSWSWYSGASACGGAGGAVRANLFLGATTANLVSPLLGTSTGGVTTITYDFKAADVGANTVGTANMGSFVVQYSPTGSGPWTTIATVSGIAQTGLCLSQSHVFTPPAGPLYVRFRASWVAGDYFMNFDNIGVTEVPPACSGTPAPGNVTGVPTTTCPGANFTLGLQNATSGTGVSYQWYASTVGNTGPWTPVGTNAATLSTSQLVQSWYYCDVTCSVGPSVGSSTVAQVDMVPAATFPQDWSLGVVNPACWSATALVGAATPDYDAASAFGVGSGSARFHFFSIITGQPTLTSPSFAPVGPGISLRFDVAGATYTGGEIDQIVLEESNDSGSTWTPIVTMDNDPVGGVLNTFGAPGTTTGDFVPTAGQWASLVQPLTPGTNRVRFRGISNFGNNVFLDNVNQVAGAAASHTRYGTGCYDLKGSIHQYFPDAAVAASALQGNVLLLTPTTDEGYSGTWLPGTAAAVYVAPVNAANLFGPPSNDGVTSLAPSTPFYTPNGPVSSLTVDANGVITLGTGLDVGYGPSSAGFAAALGTRFFSWHDFNEAEPNSGRIVWEEVGGVLYITWHNVENYSAPGAANPSTIQFQLVLASGNVTIVWLAIDSDATSPSGSAHLVGWKSSGADPRALSQDLAVTMPADTHTLGMATLALAAGPAPIVGASVNYVTSNIPEFAPGVGLYAQLLYADFGQNLPGLDLVVIGADGCNLHLGGLGQQMAGSFSPTPMATFNIPVIPPFPGFTVYFQAFALFDPAFPQPNGLNAFGLTSSNGIATFVQTF